MSADVLPLFDTHTHLDFDAFDADRDAVLERAWAAGVVGMVTIGAGRGLAHADAVAVARTDERIRATVGIHPHDASLSSPGALEEIRELATDPAVVAVGEMGLDYHYDRSPRDVARDVFARQIRIAVEVGKPIVIHSREAEDDTIAILEAEGAARCGGILHCFASDARLAEAALPMGFYVSFSGMITYGWAEAIREVARAVPEDRMLVETDAPYLPPAAHRKTRDGRNEPAFVEATLRALARVRGMDPLACAQRTTDNARAVYRLESPRDPE